MPATTSRFHVAIALWLLASAGAAAAQALPETPPPPTAKPLEPEPLPTPPPKPETEQAAPDEPSAEAGDKDMQRVAACKATALARLKEKSPSIDDIFIDVDGLTIADADGKLGNIAVKGVLMGEAYIQRDRSDRANRFLCLVGANEEVLFTFFTER